MARPKKEKFMNTDKVTFVVACLLGLISAVGAVVNFSGAESTEDILSGVFASLLTIMIVITIISSLLQRKAVKA